LPNESENELNPLSHHTYSHTLTLVNVTKDLEGKYLCHFPENEKENNISSQISHSVVAVLIPSIVSPLDEIKKLNETDNNGFTLKCVIEAYPTSLFNNSIKWEKETIDTYDNKDASDASEINSLFATKTKIISNDTHIIATVTVDKASKRHNGTYVCSVTQPIALDKNFDTKIEKYTSILIQSPPIVMIQFAKAIGKDRIYLNWTGKKHINTTCSSHKLKFFFHILFILFLL
jgi:protein-tyrosine phosphatase